jgi:mannosyltransferase OCH1-like enzyme
MKIEYTKHMIQTYKDLKNKKWEGEFIPKWVYRSGPMSLENLPESVREVYEQQILANNPGYELFYFDDADCEQFILEEWGQDYLDLYNTLIPTAYRSDFFRYLLLYNYGGIWGDFTQIPLAKFDEMTKDVDRVFCLDKPATFTNMELYNAIMMTKPNDKVLSNAISIAKGNILSRKYGANSLDITGPVVLGEAFRASEYHSKGFNKRIQIGTYNNTRILLNPDYDPIVVDQFKKPMFYKKLGMHVKILYGSHNKHYDPAWHDKTVFRQ